MYKTKSYLYSLVVCVVAFLMLKYYHFSLPYYFGFVTVYLLLMSRLFRQVTIINPTTGGTTVLNYSTAVMITAYLTVALMSVMVYTNYYEGKGQVYYNVDHHALALKGYQLPTNGTLYGRSNDAILQDTAALGQISWQLIQGTDGKVDSIVLQARDLRRSLFVRRNGDVIAYNVNASLDSMPHDGYVFHNSSIHRDLRLQIVEEPHSTWFPSPESDRALYIFTVTDSSGMVCRCDTSSIHYFIQKSLSLTTLIPSQVVSEFGNDLYGYQLTRERYKNAEGPYRLKNYAPYLRWAASFRLESYRDQQYLLEQTGPNHAVELLNRSSLHSVQSIILHPNDYFFIGFGIIGTQPMTFNENGQLLFDLPQYRPLPNEQELTEMTVTSSNDAICNHDTPMQYNILYRVPQMDQIRGKNGNRHLFEANVRFVRGATGDSIQMMLNQHFQIKAGEEFTIECRSRDTQAVMQLTDFKGITLFQPKPLLCTLLLMFLIASLMAVFTPYTMGNDKNPLDSKPKRIGPTTEMGCIMLLFVLFTTRYILCWRLSTFPPLENLSHHEYESFIKNATVFRHLTRLLPLVLAVGMLVKAAIFFYRKYWSTDAPMLLKKLKKPSIMRWFPILLLPLAVIEFLSLMFIPRGFQVLMPVAIYFVVEMFFVFIYVKNVYPEDLKELAPEKQRAYALGALRFNFSFPFFFNYAVHLGLLFMLDAGFGIMFLMFGLVRYYLVYIRYLNYLYSDKEHRLLWWLCTVIGLSLILSLFYFMPTILAVLMNNSVLGNLAMTSALGGVLFLLWLLYKFTTNNAHGIPARASYGERRTIVVAAFGAVILAAFVVLSTGMYDKVLGPDGHYTHIRYRTKVLVEDWDQTLNNERVSDGKKITRFRQASENQWILDYYYNHRPVGNDTYFKLQPMNKTGAMWGAQSTDLSFLRFGIGEHGMSYAAWLFLVMLAVFVVAMRQPVDPEKSHYLAWRNIAIGVLLLVLMQSIFVWMSVTNKFIFFGQDFPMLSITSKMTIYYVLFLLLLAIILSRPEDASSKVHFNRNERTFAITFATILVLFCAIIHFVVGENRKNKNQDAYLISLDKVEKVMYAHNKLLKYYQIQANGEYNRVVLGMNQGRNSYGMALMRDFNNNIYLGVESEEDGSPSQRESSCDCLVHVKGKQFPYIPDNNPLHDPLLNLLNGKRTPNGAYLAMSPDSVTLEIIFPQDSLYTSNERRVIETINNLFFDYQVQSRSLHLAKVRNRALRKANRAVLNASNHMLQTGDFTSFINDYIAYIDSAKTSDNSSLKSLIAKVEDDSIVGAKFTNSLVEAYAESYSKRNSPYNIIYLKRDRSTGYLQFFINKNYFSIPEMGNVVWQGSIFAKDAGKQEMLFNSNMGHAEIGDLHSNDHFEFVRLPAPWLMGEKDQYLFRANERIIIEQGVNQLDTLSRDGITAMRFDESYGANIIESNGTVRVSLPSDNYHVFAKNVWINGHRSYIYPLRECFYWARPYSNYVTQVMNDSVAMSPEAKHTNHIISLDYDLTHDLYLFMENINRGLRPAARHNLSIFVGNSDGEIVAMSDYNENPLYHMDPNDQLAIYRLQEHSYLYADYSDDRGLNGNFNLQPVLYGPGSSLKPLTFSAVASTVHEDWENFRLVGSVSYDRIKDGVNQYAGKHFNSNEYFKSVWGDEPVIGEEFDVSKYLYKSSNFFNSVVTFLGSFSEETLNSGVFEKAHDDFSIFGEKEFPVVRRNGELQCFSTIFHPESADSEPVLMKRYWDNYGVYSEPMNVNRAYLNANTLDPGLRATSLRYFTMIEPDPRKRRWMVPYERWTVSEPSFINFPARADSLELSYSMQIKSLTLGMRRIVNVSPLKMGEMYSRLFLLDKNFRFTISGERKPSSVDFEAPAFRNDSEFLKVLQSPRGFYQGLHRCAMPAGSETINDTTMSYVNGTASYLSDIDTDNLYVYAKTGTINRDRNNGGQTGLLAVIITNGDMRKAKIRNNKIFVGDRPLKFYVIYMFMDKINKKRKIAFQQGTVERVVQSRQCRKFFRLSDNHQ